MNGESAQFEIGRYGGLFWRMHKFAKAGDYHCGHKHLIDHATLVSKGGVRCEIDGQPAREYWAPAVIEIDKDVQHQFTAMADDTVYFCVFATTEAQQTLDADNAMLAGVFCNSCKGCKP